MADESNLQNIIQKITVSHKNTVENRKKIQKNILTKNKN